MLFVRLFPGALDPAKCDESLSTSFLRCHSRSDVCLGGLFQVKLQLFIQRACWAAGKEESHAAQKLSHGAGASRTSAMAVESRSQRANSASNCFLPARVSE